MPRRKKQPIVDTQKNFDKEVSNLTKEKPKRGRPKKVVEEKLKPLSPKRSYDNTDYSLFPLYREYFKEDRNTYHAGSIIARSLVDFENKINLYVDTINDSKTKSEIKNTLTDDLRLLIKKVKKL